MPPPGALSRSSRRRERVRPPRRGGSTAGPWSSDIARTTVPMPFSGSTRPTTPTIGSSGWLLSRARQDASGGPG